MEERTIPRMVTINEAAAATGLAAHRVRQLCLSEEIVFIKAGRKYLINLDRFIDYLNTAHMVEEKPVATLGLGKIRPVEVRRRA